MNMKESFLQALIPAVTQSFMTKLESGELSRGITIYPKRDLELIKSEIMSNPLTASAWRMVGVEDEDLIEVIVAAAKAVGLEFAL